MTLIELNEGNNTATGFRRRRSTEVKSGEAFRRHASLEVQPGDTLRPFRRRSATESGFRRAPSNQVKRSKSQEPKQLPKIIQPEPELPVLEKTPQMSPAERHRELLEKLQAIKKAEEDKSGERLLSRLQTVRAGLHSTLASCHSTMEMSGSALADFYRKLPKAKLQQQINERFNFFDRDGNGSLDREEVRSGMAEMGQRPTDAELDCLFTRFDADRSGTIDRDEFSQMIRVKLGLACLEDDFERTPARRRPCGLAIGRTSSSAFIRSPSKASRSPSSESSPTGSLKSSPLLSMESSPISSSIPFEKTRSVEKGWVRRLVAVCLEEDAAG